MDTQELYMQRCLDLAANGAGNVSPNPMVGAVLVHQDRIIGEGWHRQIGQPHAEVNCLQSVAEEHKPLIKESTLYVSLEPCAHFGKTPPCADLIIKNKIPEVVIGIRDPFEAVNGKGIERLKAAGVKVTTGILQEKCRLLNKRFFTFHTQKRPFIILKWAASLNGKTAMPDGSRALISNAYSNRLVHKWRSREDAIMVGTNTALMDDPSLTTRLWEGKNPVRVVLDASLRVPATRKVLDGAVRTIVFNTQKQEEAGNILYYRISPAQSLIDQVVRALYQLNVQSVLVEGGTGLLQSFMDEGAWDEARVITNTEMMIENGFPGPALSDALLKKKEDYQNDVVHYFVNKRQA